MPQSHEDALSASIDRAKIRREEVRRQIQNNRRDYGAAHQGFYDEEMFLSQYIRDRENDLEAFLEDKAIQAQESNA